MHTSTLAAALFTLLSTVTAYGTNKPVCATKCWTNSQYVSPLCGEDIQCLCDDTEFQQSVYQCLYSQCQTAHFGSALHHTLTMCHDHKAHEEAKKKKKAPEPTIPALIRNQIDLQRRQNMPMQSNSNSRYMSASVSRSRPMMSVSRSVTHSRPMMSVSRSVTHSRPRPTMSVSNSAFRGPSSSRALPMVSQIPDGQVQASAAIPMSAYMSEMAAMGMPVVTQIGDGQIQAPAPTSSPVVQIPDGQPQASQGGFMKRFDVRNLLGQL